MEAVIGAITYHRSHEESIRATGYVCGDNDNQMNTVLAAYVRGYQPESVYHHIADDIVLINNGMVEGCGAKDKMLPLLYNEKQVKKCNNGG